MNKTLYLREDEAPIWERARELSNDKVSPIIVTALKRFIEEKEAEMRGFERIVVPYRDAAENGMPKAKAFYGKWLIPREEKFDVGDRWGTTNCAVAVTAKGAVVVYTHLLDQDGNEEEHFRHFGSFAQAIADPAVTHAAREAMERQGVAVEELDI